MYVDLCVCKPWLTESMRLYTFFGMFDDWSNEFTHLRGSGITGTLRIERSRRRWKMHRIRFSARGPV